MRPASETIKKVKGLVLDNLHIKLFSLMFAVMLWMYAASKGATEVNFVVPLELADIPEGMVVVGEPQGLVEVRLAGSEGLLKGLSSKDVRASISLKGAKGGDTLYSLGPDNIRAPAGVEVSRISPVEIRVGLDSLSQKTLPVEPALAGEPAPGYRVKGARVVPDKVIATGPKRVLDGLDKVATEPVDVSGISGGFERQVGLEARAEGDVKLGQKRVTIVVELARTGAGDGRGR